MRHLSFDDDLLRNAEVRCNDFQRLAVVGRQAQQLEAAILRQNQTLAQQAYCLQERVGPSRSIKGPGMRENELGASLRRTSRLERQEIVRVKVVGHGYKSSSQSWKSTGVGFLDRLAVTNDPICLTHNTTLEPIVAAVDGSV